jgi:OmcA/MtrC family decaheme c-type cytochrome
MAGATAIEYVLTGSFNVPGWAGTKQPYPAPTATAGQYTWTATTALPAADPNKAPYTGADTVAFAIESADGNAAAPYAIEVKGVTSDVFFWRLDNQNSSSAKPLTRRVLVDGAKCVACHGDDFGFHHAGSRNNAQECAFCHNAVTTNNAGATLKLPTSGRETRVAQSIQLSVMVHKIHTGAASADPAWAYYGHSGDKLERATYPGNLLDCAQCHVTPTAPNSSVWGLPLNAAVYPTTTTKEFSCITTACTQVGANILTTQTAAVCGSCHDSGDAKAHMAQNVVAVGSSQTETCDLCHGLYRDADVRKLHTPVP